MSTCPPRTAESWIAIHFAPLTRFKKKKKTFFLKLEDSQNNKSMNAAVGFLRKQVMAVHS